MSNKKRLLSFFGVSDTGNKRNVNEDTFIFDESSGIWVVADGMGGHGSGDVASRIAAEHIIQRIKKGYSLTDSIYFAHEEVLTSAKFGQGQWGMGTTVVALKVCELDYEIAWVGDSRAYLLEDKQMYQITRDHSLVQQMVDRGEISEDEAEFHPQRNVIVQAIGSPEVNEISVDLVTGTLQDGDIILLCSDGLTTEVSEIEIARILLENDDPKNKVHKLVAAALNAGGKDNITVVIVEKKIFKGLYGKLNKLYGLIKGLF